MGSTVFLLNERNVAYN